MPALREDIDRAGIAAQIALMGIRPTARATGLPVGTVQDIAEQMKVKLPTRPMKLTPIEPKRAETVADVSLQRPYNRPAHAVISETLSDQEAPTKLGLAIAARTVADHARIQAAEDLLIRGSEYHTWTKTAASVHGWDAKTQQPQAVVNIALLGMEPDQAVQRGTVLDGPVPDQA